jgi:DNA primase
MELPASVAIPYQGKNLAYLEDRGITAEVAQYFGLRLCMKGYFRFQGLDGQEKFQPYHQRVIIPVRDLEGNLVTFQGRDITGTSPMKYLFPPGLAATSTLLYNGQNVRNTHQVVICEGVFDVIAVKMAFDADPALRDVVPIATFGKHLSEPQEAQLLELKARGVTEITMMWDAEKEALKAAILTGLRLRAVGFSVRLAILPPGKDPNEVPPEVVRMRYRMAQVLDRSSATRIGMLAAGMKSPSEIVIPRV